MSARKLSLDRVDMLVPARSHGRATGQCPCKIWSSAVQNIGSYSLLKVYSNGLVVVTSNWRNFEWTRRSSDQIW